MGVSLKIQNLIWNSVGPDETARYGYEGILLTSHRIHFHDKIRKSRGGGVEEGGGVCVCVCGGG